MGRKVFLPLLVLTLFSFISYAQTGEIRGRVTEPGGKEGVPFASVAAFMNGSQIQGTVTDFDGNYSIKPLNPGKYDVKVTCVGYNAKQVNGVLVTADKIAFANFEMNKGVELKAVEVVEYSVPLIDKGSPSSAKTVTYEEIQAAPTRDVNSIASQTAGVYQKDQGDALNIRGSRSDGTVYFVDGIKVRGSVGLPQKGQEQITVITGGVPAQYGDATGGIISITTRGPSRDYAGGVELATSELFDEYGYKLGAFDFSGPILSERDSTGRKSRSMAGFFLAGEYQGDRDANPSAIPIYVVKSDVLDDVRQYPLVRSPFGANYIHRSNFFTYDDLTTQKYRPNVSSNAVRLNGKLDFAPTKNLNFTLGGSFERNYSHDYIDIYSLMNYDQNPVSTTYNWRVFGKMTQRFTQPENEKASSNIKNAFYTIQADYSKNTGVSESEVHRDRIFDYGYLGKFTRYSVPFFVPEAIERPGSTDSLVFTQVANVDTLFDFSPGTQNPFTSNYTSQYYALTDPLGTFGYQDNYDDVILRGGLVNGDNRAGLNVYGLFATPGRVRNGFSKYDNSQFRFVASFSADIKNHNIIVGGEFEQRTDRGYSVAASSLWSLARFLGNANITGYDQSTAQVAYDYSNGDTATYVTFDSKYEPTTNLIGQVAPGFYENIRSKLGVSLTDTVQIDALDPSQFSLDLFTPDELSGFVGYYGYDYLGNKQTTRPGYMDYFDDQDEFNNFTRNVDAFRPTYIAGYIQDRFNFNDLTFNIGVRVDYFDANQYVLKDKYLLFDSYRAGDQQAKDLGFIPDAIGDDYAVYVNSVNNPTEIVGFRNEDQWYDANGNQITDLTPLLQGGGNSNGIQPYVKDPNDVQNATIRSSIFKRYEPQVNVMPRIAFAFPISDEANFKAHYDVLTQRPQDGGLLRFNPASYRSLAQGVSATISNPDLKPERTTEYELSFQQRLSRSSALSISAFYRELRDMIQIINVLYAYPINYQTYGNIDFGTTKGLSFAYDLRRTNNVRMSISYTLSFANGTGSDPNTNAGLLAQQGQTNLREPKPLNFDQRHTFVTSFDYHYGSGKDYNGPVWGGKQVFSNAGMNLVFRAGSGTPYTRKSNITPTADFTSAANSRSIIEGQLNGSRLPWQFRIDARFDKSFDLKTGKRADGEARKPLSCQVYLQILNVLNTQNIIGVYAATGSPSDDGYITSPGAQANIQSKVDPNAYVDLYQVAVNNPSNYSLPRRMRLGFMVNF